jgi:hypothetical protein
MEYIVLCGQVIGGGDRAFSVEYDFDGTKFDDLQAAIKHGMKVRESDDFNIGVIKNGKLTRLDWMDKPVETDPKILKKITEQIDL